MQSSTNNLQEIRSLAELVHEHLHEVVDDERIHETIVQGAIKAGLPDTEVTRRIVRASSRAGAQLGVIFEVVLGLEPVQLIGTDAFDLTSSVLDAWVETASKTDHLAELLAELHVRVFNPELAPDEGQRFDAESWALQREAEGLTTSPSELVGQLLNRFTTV